VSPSTDRAPRGRARRGANAPHAELRARLAELTLRDEHRLGRRLERLRGRGDDAQLVALTREVEQAEARVARRRAAVPAIDYPPQLPVTARREDLLATIREHQVTIVAGETGSGKSTQLPKICLELGRGVRGTIAHTQPRRLAARTVAARIAEELRTPLGEAIGYAVRFNDRSGEDTLVRMVTDGLLLAEIQHDRLLRRYDTVIVDEAHERSLNIDFLLGCLKRILPRRPDLKLVITSATIDTQRLSAHFGDAPVVEVSGRAYPVQTRYRPVPDAEHDRLDAIPDAVRELLDAEPANPGDVLVFLSGEREIRDTAELLRSRLDADVEILPLYARLSSAEQQRVFAGHRARRVVLATNVAETSLTVPGIRYVVDPGTARISRYSARLKVQRLPIEPISQASADQRKGRCGRTADGICIRLYDEEDFAARARFTDPEILRTSLASVILQMAALGLGDVADFPFLDPPDPRQVRDGVALLRELGALEPAVKGGGHRLTPLGRRLARLPVDPRLGRMVLEGDRLGCAREAIVIAAALSIQDPRERPAEARAAADQQHARFNDAEPRSDFLAYLSLWRYLREQQAELSGSQFRKHCKAELIHFLRVREWQDLVGQLTAAAKSVDVTVNEQPAEPDQIHMALLAGLLSHVGLRDTAATKAPARGRRPVAEYTGARGARFALSPGSALSKQAPEWTMVAELVETTRLWGRTAARIEPAWVEALAPAHLLRRTYGEPRWDARRSDVVADERVTLYGLPVVAGRQVSYGRIDPAGARELFIRRALVEGEWETRHAFFHENRARVAEVEALEERARRRDLLVGDQVLHNFYDARIPSDVVSGAHFDRWWREASAAEPDRLTLPRELLLDPGAAAGLDARDRPEAWKQGELTLKLSYRFEPGTDHDGVTAHVPLSVITELRPDGFEWLVPAFRQELVTTLIRSLPKELRKPLVPAPDLAGEALARIPPRSGPLLDALAAELERLRGVRIPAAAWDLARLPAHLRMRFLVEDEEGRAVAEGEDLAALRERVRPQLRAQLAAAAPAIERSGLRAWEIGALPRVVAPAAAGGLRAYPALVDEGETVGVRLLETPEAQAAAMHAGTRRLLLLSVPSTVKYVQEHLPPSTQLSLAAAPHGSAAAVVQDATVAAADALIAAAGGPAWDEAGFARLRAHVAGELAEATTALLRQVAEIVAARRAVQRRMDELVAPPLQPACLDVARQLGGLVYAGFVTVAGPARLPDILRYVQGAERRLERLPSTVAVDRDRMTTVHTLEAAYDARVTACREAGRSLPPSLREAGWMLQELRVSQFAQALGTRGAVSAKRVRKLLEQAGPA
jgi:ATP-dependent helicase HrpA